MVSSSTPPVGGKLQRRFALLANILSAAPILRNGSLGWWELQLKPSYRTSVRSSFARRTVFMSIKRRRLTLVPYCLRPVTLLAGSVGGMCYGWKLALVGMACMPLAISVSSVFRCRVVDRRLPADLSLLTGRYHSSTSCRPQGREERFQLCSERSDDLRGCRCHSDGGELDAGERLLPTLIDCEWRRMM